jgi:hypothetical protein
MVTINANIPESIPKNNFTESAIIILYVLPFSSYCQSLSQCQHFFHFLLRKPPLHRIRAKHILRRLVQALH